MAQYKVNKVKLFYILTLKKGECEMENLFNLLDKYDLSPEEMGRISNLGETLEQVLESRNITNQVIGSIALKRDSDDNNKEQQEKKDYLRDTFNPFFEKEQHRMMLKDHIETTKDFLKYWYEENYNLFLCVAGKNKNEDFIPNMCKLDVLLDNLDLYLKSNVNLYTSLHMFIRPQRTSECCYLLNGIALDLDYLHPPKETSTQRDIQLYNRYKNMSQQEIVERFYNLYIATNRLPMPTLVLWAGRGLSVWYKVKNQNARYKKKIYNRLFNLFTEILEEERIDLQCGDYARVMRPAHSYHTGVLSATSIVHMDKENIWNSFEDLLRDIDNAEYDNFIKEKQENIIKYAELQAKILERERAEEEKLSKMTLEEKTEYFKQKEIAKQKFLEQKARQKVDKDEAIDYYNKIICRKRYLDIETLVRLRKGKSMEGYRTILLLIYACNLLYSQQYAENTMIEKVYELNELVCQEEKEIENIIASAIKSNQEYISDIIKVDKVCKKYSKAGYHYKNATIIKLLGISEMEMIYLKAIKYDRGTPEYKEMKRKEMRMKRGKVGQDISSSKKEELKNLYDKIIDLKVNKGIKTNKEIGEILGIERTKVGRTIKKFTK